ncbi:MAG: FtsX-like permease family protein [Clostridium sp.]|nr:FtsX-like permease family protein [Clostridium sp.]
MKSFFNFLKNNKAYTAIDVFGLSLSFMFVILIGGYAWQETHMDHCYAKADRIFALGFTNENGKDFATGHWAMQRALRGAYPEIESTTAVLRGNSGFHIGENDVLTQTMFVDSTFLNIFDIELLEGDPRTALADKHSAIVSEKFAQANFGDGEAIGQRFSWQADTVYFIVTGVMRMPEQSTFKTSEYENIDVICRIEMQEYTGGSQWIFDETISQLGGVDVYLLATPGEDLTKKVGEYQNFLREHFENLKEIGDEGRWKLNIFPLKSMYYEGISSSGGNRLSGDKDLVNMLGAVGGIVLLFALLNYVNLTVALAGKRAKEMATRRLLGSRRAGIVGRLIGESALLCMLSLAIGIGLAFLLEPYTYTSLGIYINLKACVNAETICITAGIWALMSVAAGIIPALLISANKPIDVVRGSFRRHTKMYFSKVIIVAQNAITIAMIVCSLGMFLQVRHLINAPLGYDTSNKIMIYNIGIGSWRMKIIHDECAKLPEITRINNTWGNPLTGSSLNYWRTESGEIYANTITADSTFFDFWGIEKLRDNHVIDGEWVTPGLLETLGLDETAADFPQWDDRTAIAGVISDFHIGGILEPQNKCKMVYIREIDSPWVMFLEYTGDAATALQKVREEYDKVSPIPLDQDFYFVEDFIKDYYSDQRNVAAIMIIFACVAIVISLLGLLAMSTYYVQQRENEIAVRKVFGSTAAGIIRNVTKSFVTYVLIAFVIAVPVSYHLLGDWLSKYSYRIPVYWWLFAIALAFTIGVTALTVYTQTRRAANANPVDSLKMN